MTLTAGEIEAINAILAGINSNVNEILNAREDVNALLRIAGDIDSDSIENNILVQAKARALTASQALVTLLS